MNVTMSTIILQALIKAEAGLSSEMIQMMPAFSTFGTRYSLILAKSFSLRSPTCSLIVLPEPADALGLELLRSAAADFSRRSIAWPGRLWR